MKSCTLVFSDETGEGVEWTRHVPWPEGVSAAKAVADHIERFSRVDIDAPSVRGRFATATLGGDEFSVTVTLQEVIAEIQPPQA